MARILREGGSVGEQNVTRRKGERHYGRRLANGSMRWKYWYASQLRLIDCRVNCVLCNKLPL